MCGITGLIALDSRVAIDPHLLDTMTDSMAHRGPDGRGVWLGSGAGLGHRRLAIIEPEAGQQPWSEEGVDGVLVYNGELYNHADLRIELEEKGYRFRSSCDTEVVFKALKHWGVREALERFRGMFAIGFWENGPRRLTLARDPMGVKPLYWAMRGGMVRFGSEIKCILADRDFPRTLDPTTLINYMAHYRLTFKNRSLFKYIQEVPAGGIVQWEGKRRSEERYWRVPIIREADKQDAGEEKTAAVFRDLLKESVRKRLMADVPLGAYLSGGIDSAVIVALMRELKHDNMATFSIGFEEGNCNEFEFSQQVASQLNTTHHQVTLTETGYFKEFESLIHIKDTPLSVPNEVPLRFLSRHLKKRISVVLSGEGADELLGGYQFLVRSPHDYLLARAIQENPTSFPDEVRSRLEAGFNQLYGQTRFSGQCEQFLKLYQWIPEEQRSVLFAAGIRVDHAEEEIRDYWEETWGELDQAGIDPYEKVLHVLEEVHLSALLRRLDATTMAEGVEGRVPYTDRDLIEWVVAQPLKYKTRWRGAAEEKQARHTPAMEAVGTLDIGKYLLRLAFAGSIPDDILLRPKAAFPVPLDDWFFGPRQAWAKERIMTGRMSNLFNLKEVERIMTNARSTGEGMKIWMLANIGVWLEMYFN